MLLKEPLPSAGSGALAMAGLEWNGQQAAVGTSEQSPVITHIVGEADLASRSSAGMGHGLRRRRGG